MGKLHNITAKLSSYKDKGGSRLMITLRPGAAALRELAMDVAKRAHKDALNAEEGAKPYERGMVVVRQVQEWFPDPNEDYPEPDCTCFEMMHPTQALQALRDPNTPSTGVGSVVPALEAGMTVNKRNAYIDGLDAKKQTPKKGAIKWGKALVDQALAENPWKPLLPGKPLTMSCFARDNSAVGVAGMVRKLDGMLAGSPLKVFGLSASLALMPPDGWSSGDTYVPGDGQHRVGIFCNFKAFQVPTVSQADYALQRSMWHPTLARVGPYVLDVLKQAKEMVIDMSSVKEMRSHFDKPPLHVPGFAHDLMNTDFLELLALDADAACDQAGVLGGLEEGSASGKTGLRQRTITVYQASGDGDRATDGTTGDGSALLVTQFAREMNDPKGMAGPGGEDGGGGGGEATKRVRPSLRLVLMDGENVDGDKLWSEKTPDVMRHNEAAADVRFLVVSFSGPESGALPWAMSVDSAITMGTHHLVPARFDISPDVVGIVGDPHNQDLAANDGWRGKFVPASTGRNPKGGILFGYANNVQWMLPAYAKLHCPTASFDAVRAFLCGGIHAPAEGEEISKDRAKQVQALGYDPDELMCGPPPADWIAWQDAKRRAYSSRFGVRGVEPKEAAPTSFPNRMGWASLRTWHADDTTSWERDALASGGKPNGGRLDGEGRAMPGDAEVRLFVAPMRTVKGKGKKKGQSWDEDVILGPHERRALAQGGTEVGDALLQATEEEPFDLHVFMQKWVESEGSDDEKAARFVMSAFPLGTPEEGADGVEVLLAQGAPEQELDRIRKVRDGDAGALADQGPVPAEVMRALWAIPGTADGTGKAAQYAAMRWMCPHVWTCRSKYEVMQRLEDEEAEPYPKLGRMEIWPVSVRLDAYDMRMPSAAVRAELATPAHCPKPIVGVNAKRPSTIADCTATHNLVDSVWDAAIRRGADEADAEEKPAAAAAAAVGTKRGRPAPSPAPAAAPASASSSDASSEDDESE